MSSSSSKEPAYVPILKWKRGEQMALRDLPRSARRKIFPLIEVQDRPFDWDRGDVGAYTISWPDHLKKVVDAAVKYWGGDEEIAVDQPIEDGDDMAGESAWRYLFESLWQAGVAAVPVVSSLASELEVDTLRKLKAPARVNGRFVLRFQGSRDDDDILLDSISSWFRAMLRRLRVDHESIDAILDLGYLSDEGANLLGPMSNMELVERCAEIITSIGLQGPWRSLTLAAGSFPENLAGLPVGLHRLARRDWQLYRLVNQEVSRRHRLGYGDYGVNYTDVLDIDPRLVRMSASLRYTHTKDWIVYKARSVRSHGFEQYRDLCRLLVNSEDQYMGDSFSKGDANYAAVASGEVGPGNATIWRRDATNHHVHMVISQLHNS